MLAYAIIAYQFGELLNGIKSRFRKVRNICLLIHSRRH
jgi:hypothetical protein